MYNLIQSNTILSGLFVGCSVRYFKSLHMKMICVSWHMLKDQIEFKKTELCR